MVMMVLSTESAPTPNPTKARTNSTSCGRVSNIKTYKILSTSTNKFVQLKGNKRIDAGGSPLKYDDETMEWDFESFELNCHGPRSPTDNPGPTGPILLIRIRSKASGQYLCFRRKGELFLWVS
ncbi:unnamed protein product, partial [Darwinula stevensoni]